MAELGQLAAWSAGPPSGARLQTLQCQPKRRAVTAEQLALGDDPAVGIDAVHLEPALGEVKADGGICMADGSCCAYRRPRCGRSMPDAGAVHHQELGHYRIVGR